MRRTRNAERTSTRTPKSTTTARIAPSPPFSHLDSLTISPLHPVRSLEKRAGLYSIQGNGSRQTGPRHHEGEICPEWKRDLELRRRRGRQFWWRPRGASLGVLPGSQRLSSSKGQSQRKLAAQRDRPWGKTSRGGCSTEGT